MYGDNKITSERLKQREVTAAKHHHSEKRMSRNQKKYRHQQRPRPGKSLEEPSKASTHAGKSAQTNQIQFNMSTLYNTVGVDESKHDHSIEYAMRERGTAAFVSEQRGETDGIERYGRGKEGNVTCPGSENIGGIRRIDVQSDGDACNRNTTVLSSSPTLETLISSKSNQGHTLSNRVGRTKAEAANINAGNTSGGVGMTSDSLGGSYTPPPASHNSPLQVKGPPSPTPKAHVAVGQHANISMVLGGSGSPERARSTGDVHEPTVLSEQSKAHTNTVADAKPIRSFPRVVNVVSARQQNEGVEGGQAGGSAGESAFSYSGEGGREVATHAGGRGKSITNQPQQRHQQSAEGVDLAHDKRSSVEISQNTTLRDEEGTQDKHQVSKPSPESRSYTSPSVDPKRLGLEVEEFGHVQDFNVEDISDIEIGEGWESGGGGNWIEGSPRASTSS